MDSLISSTHTMAGKNPSSYDALLIHSTRDKAAVESVGAWLEQQGFHVLLDKGNLNPGDPLDDSIARALRAARCLLVFLGPHSLGRWQTEEAHAFLEATLGESDLRLIPILLPGIPPDAPQQIPLYFQRQLWVRFDRDTTETPVLEAIARALRLAREAAEATPPGPTPSRLAASDCPYPGLEAFGEAQAEVFFGRERLVQHLLLRLHTSQFLAVLGPPSSGKSSVVLAGVLPELRAQGWLCEVLTPRHAPLERLAATFAAMQTPEAKWTATEILDHLREAGAPILGVLADEILDQRDHEHLLLVLDQFEEIFDEATDPAERARLYRLLAAAAQAFEPRVRIVITLRSDFLGHCAQDPDMNTLVTRHLVQVGPMDEPSLRRAIVGPAARKGLRLEDGLEDIVVVDFLARQQQPLSLLQHALQELFWRRKFRDDRDTLTLDAYRAMGGIEGALGARAENRLHRIEERWGARGVEVLRRLTLLHLVQPRETTAWSRRAVPLNDLRHSGADAALVDQILADWVEARLLVRIPAPERLPRDPRKPAPDEAAEPAEDRVRLAHDALLAHWPRLRQWMEGQRDDLRAIQALRHDATRWLEHGRSQDWVLTGARLLDAEDLAARFPDTFPQDLAEYIAASAQVRNESGRGRVETLERQLREATDLADARAAALREADAAARESSLAQAQLEERLAAESAARQRSARRARAMTWAFAVLALAVLGAGAAAWLKWGGLPPGLFP